MANLRDMAYSLIKKKILTCEYGPNRFLNEAELKEELQVSRTPIREALTRLEQEGLVMILPKKGVMVNAPTINDINQSFEVRILMEPFILKNYMKYIDQQELKVIREQFVTLINAKPFGAEFAPLDDHFHRVIAQACPNVFLLGMLNKVFDLNVRIRAMSGRDLWDRHVEAAKEHIELIDFILAGEVEHAVKAMYNHLDTSKKTALISLSSKQLAYK